MRSSSRLDSVQGVPKSCSPRGVSSPLPAELRFTDSPSLPEVATEYLAVPSQRLFQLLLFHPLLTMLYQRIYEFLQYHALQQALHSNVPRPPSGRCEAASLHLEH